MNTELLNTTVNEVTTKTLVDWHNLILANLEIIQKNWTQSIILNGRK